MRRAGALILALGLAATSPAQAFAEGAVAQAKAYYDAGAQAYSAGQYAAAIQAFTEAYELVPKSSILFSLAQAERRQYTAERDPRHLASAIAHFRKYLEEVPQGGRRVDAVEALGELEAVASRLDKPKEATAPPKEPSPTRLMISTSTKAAVIALDGIEHTELPLIELVLPGKHTVHVSAPGYIDDEREVIAVEGTLVPFEIELRERPSYLALTAPLGALVNVDGQPYGEAPLATAIDLAPGPHVISVTRRGYRPYLKSALIERGQTLPLHATLTRSTQRMSSYAFLGGSAASAIGGALFAFGALHQENIARQIKGTTASRNLTQERLDEYNMTLDSRAALRRDAAIMFGITAGLALTAAALYLFDDPTPSPRDVQRSAGAPRVSFTLGPAGAGIGVVGRF